MKQKRKHILPVLAMLAAFLLSCILGGADVKASVKAKKITLSSKKEQTFVGGGIYPKG